MLLINEENGESFYLTQRGKGKLEASGVEVPKNPAGGPVTVEPEEYKRIWDLARG